MTTRIATSTCSWNCP